MSTTGLFINDEFLGSDCFVGTREEFKKELAPCFASWWENDQETSAASLEEYTEEALDKHLRPADDEDVANYPHI